MRKAISVSCGIVALFTVVAVASAQGTGAAARGDAFPGPSTIVGRIVPARQAAAAWSVEGRIVEVNIEEGDRVKKGDMLARVDARPYEFKLQAAKGNYLVARAVHVTLLKGAEADDLQALEAQLTAARARLDVAETSFKRLKALLDQGAVGGVEVQRSEMESVRARGEVAIIEARIAALKRDQSKPLIEKAEAELKLAELEIEAAQRAVKETVLVAPVDGIVTDVQSLLGDYVRPSRFCRILDDSRLRIEARTVDMRGLKAGARFVATFLDSDEAAEATLLKARWSDRLVVLMLDLENPPQGTRLGAKVRLTPKD